MASTLTGPAPPPIPVPTARRRPSARGGLVAPMPRDGVWGWLGPVLVMLLAGALRFWRLDVPGKVAFDELYYTDQAQDLLRYGVEYDEAKNAPEYVVHPPVGKWVIAVGEWLFGDEPFGWRFTVAVLGTLSVLIVARAGRRMFRSTLLGVIAGVLLTVDGMHFVESRTALLDPILMFFVLAAFAALLVDRDRSRELLAADVDAREPGTLGPSLGLRPWRLLAGLCLGLACSTKWSGAFVLAAFGLMSVLWDVGARRAAGVRRPWSGALVHDSVPAFLSLVGSSLVVYVASWSGWFAAGPDRAYGRDYAARTDAGPSWVPDGLVSLVHYHRQALDFHTGLTSPHGYESNPWGWLVLSRPVSFFYEGSEQGDPGCDVAACSQGVTALGTAAIWWAACLALPVLLGLWIGARDWRAGAILAGVGAGYLPWFAYQERTIFSSYAVAFVPFLVLAVAMVLGLIIGSREGTYERRVLGAVVVGTYLLVAILDFAWLYPILAGEVIPYPDWYRRMLFRSWV